MSFSLLYHSFTTRNAFGLRPRPPFRARSTNNTSVTRHTNAQETAKFCNITELSVNFFPSLIRL